jgi:hypothetical protein
MSCWFDDSFQARSGWNVQCRTPDDGQRTCPKHVEFLDKNKFGNHSASIGCIKKKRINGI